VRSFGFAQDDKGHSERAGGESKNLVTPTTTLKHITPNPPDPSTLLRFAQDYSSLSV